MAVWLSLMVECCLVFEVASPSPFLAGQVTRHGALVRAHLHADVIFGWAFSATVVIEKGKIEDD